MPHLTLASKPLRLREVPNIRIRLRDGMVTCCSWIETAHETNYRMNQQATKIHNNRTESVLFQKVFIQGESFKEPSTSLCPFCTELFFFYAAVRGAQSPCNLCSNHNLLLGSIVFVVDLKISRNRPAIYVPQTLSNYRNTYLPARPTKSISFNGSQSATAYC